MQDNKPKKELKFVSYWALDEISVVFKSVDKLGDVHVHLCSERVREIKSYM